MTWCFLEMENTARVKLIKDDGKKLTFLYNFSIFKILIDHGTIIQQTKQPCVGLLVKFSR